MLDKKEIEFLELILNDPDIVAKSLLSDFVTLNKYSIPELVKEGK